GDLDKDGMDNLAEFLAGTDPSNALSRLEITAVSPAATGATVAWRSAPLRMYRLMYSTNLLDAAAWRERGMITNTSATSLSLTDPQGVGCTVGVYRVECGP
ncbi:MAG: hypothetical protein WCS01_16400, partial [bacterium]